ncbi:MAG: Rne/Rng family ribonuclease [Proteobacteria bacterium]|nr:Rne/Rng family ribonuclease [Pseudomonadota bacterium]MBU1739466.1 Rne/Rng family ribonuclease [Pseudomonadota bacterium]
MAEDTTNRKTADNQEKKNKPLSVISKISKWLTGKKDESVNAPPATEGGNPGSAGENKPPARSRKRSHSGNRRRPGKGGAAKQGQSEKEKEGGGAPEQRTKEPAKPAAARKPRPRPGVKRQKEEPVEEVVDEVVSRKLLINTHEPEECRIAMIENGRVEAFYVETILHAQSKGNIYKGRVEAIEPSLQAVFVDIGEGKNGFLPFSEIHPEYFRGDVSADTHWKDVNMEKAIQKGDEVLLQVVKEALGNKGANMTTYLSLPGRYLVLMPGSDSAGISRKIESESQRSKLRTLVNSLKLPEGIGYIVRTASKEITKAAVTMDLNYLLNLWDEIKERGQRMSAPALIYKEQDIIARFLRDHFTSDIEEILVDSEDAYEKVRKFLKLLPAGQNKTVARLHGGTKPIFNHHQVEKQIEQIYQPTVSLPSGGSIVISPTEALVAIDVNSGRTAKDKNFEEMIFQANMEAAEEMARQLRLRDLGGLIVVDFIDMRSSRNIREVEKQVKVSMKRDKAKVDISRISKFGLMQISRQKMASPVQRGIYTVCEHCQGRGLVRSVETLALSYLRRIQTGITRKNIRRIDCILPEEAANYLLDNKGEEIRELEGRHGVAVKVIADREITAGNEKFEFVKN